MKNKIEFKRFRFLGLVFIVLDSLLILCSLLLLLVYWQSLFFLAFSILYLIYGIKLFKGTTCAKCSNCGKYIIIHKFIKKVKCNKCSKSYIIKEDCIELIEPKIKVITAPTTENVSITNTTEETDYFIREIKVVGVTYKNNQGFSRQSILEKISKKQSPFDKQPIITLNKWSFNGETALNILANGQDIGSVPSEKVEYISKNLDRIKDDVEIKVYGGGLTENGEIKNYGAVVKLKIKKK